MTTLTNLITFVARDLRDPTLATFTTQEITDFINAGIDAVSEVAPRQAQEDIEPDGSNEYTPLTVTRPTRVEVWSVAPQTIHSLHRIPAAAEGFTNETDVGWKMWAGVLTLPYGFAAYLADDTKNLRIWGYAPYTQLVNGGDTADLSNNAEWAVREYAALQGYERLMNDRSLFANWQTQSNNTDVSVAALINAWATRSQQWERRRKQLTILQESPH